MSSSYIEPSYLLSNAVRSILFSLPYEYDTRSITTFVCKTPKSFLEKINKFCPTLNYTDPLTIDDLTFNLLDNRFTFTYPKKSKLYKALTEYYMSIPLTEEPSTPILGYVLGIALMCGGLLLLMKYN